MFDAETTNSTGAGSNCVGPVWYVNWEEEIAGHHYRDAASLIQEETVMEYLGRYSGAGHQRTGLDPGRASVIVDFETVV